MENNNKPQILLTNDDSINSPGLWAAAEALSPLGFVHVVAPRVQQTSMGRAFPADSDGIVEPQTLVVNGKEWEVYGVGGSPAQAVLHGIMDVLKGKPDLVVSGINYGENMASGLTISGTVGAALEAATLGIPALATSLQTPTGFHYNLSPEVDFTVAAWFTHYFAEKMLKNELPADLDVLNLNVPGNATTDTPWRVTRQSRQRYFFPVPKDPNDSSRAMGYEARVDRITPEENSDVRALILDGVVSITPISFDMTSRIDFDELHHLLED